MERSAQSPLDSEPRGASSVAPESAPRPHADAVLEPGASESVDTILIDRPRATLYAYWRDFTHLPAFMERVKRVTEVDSVSSLWTVVGIDGEVAEWEFLVTDDERDRLIAWSTSGHTPVKYAGRVEFHDAPTGGTVVTAVIHQDPPDGLFESLLARVTGKVPVVQMRGDLLRFKRLMEGLEAAPPQARDGALEQHMDRQSQPESAR
jgi:uncharacterized membrane protein